MEDKIWLVKGTESQALSKEMEGHLFMSLKFIYEDEEKSNRSTGEEDSSLSCLF